ncbi:MAG: thioredoxin family protein [Gemmatimonadaceae bacterium]|nr:thioredoxin family protein [Gemmatimonadaceae bacterium]
MILSLVVAANLVMPTATVCVGALAPQTPAAAGPRVSAPQQADTVADSTLVALYASGTDFATFLAAAEARKAAWQKNWTEGRVPEDAVAVAQSLPGKWRLLVVAVDGCSDSVNTIPYIARLVARVPSLEMRIVLPEPGRPVMEAHRTPDGRPATPTVVLLDEAGRNVGCWIERPAELQRQAVAAREAGTLDAFQRGKQAWYDADAGASTVREVGVMLEAAAAGSPRCDAKR